MRQIPVTLLLICFSTLSVSAIAAGSTDSEAVVMPEAVPQSALPMAVAGVVFPAYVLDQNDKILRVSQKVDDANESLTSISSQVFALKQSFWERLYPALFGVLGVAIAGLVNYFLQARQMTHNESERKDYSSIVINKIMNFMGRYLFSLLRAKS